MDDFDGILAPAPKRLVSTALPLTVVIIALVGGRALDRCATTMRELGVNFVIVDRLGHCLDSEGDDLNGQNSAVSVPARRRLGLDFVQTPYVAFIEDTVVPSVTWIEAIVPTLGQEGVAGMGGAISIADSLPSKFRALGLCEYGRFQEPQFRHLATGARTPSGQMIVNALPGANFAFRTRELLAIMPRRDDGMVDNEIFARLREGRLALVFEPSMNVVYTEAYAAGAALAARYGHGRIYSSRTYMRSSPGVRAAAALKSLALPLVLFFRSLCEAPPGLLRAPMTLIWVAAQHVSWSAGEFAGTVFGAAPDGLDQWN